MLISEEAKCFSEQKWHHSKKEMSIFFNKTKYFTINTLKRRNFWISLILKSVKVCVLVASSPQYECSHRKFLLEIYTSLETFINNLLHVKIFFKWWILIWKSISKFWDCENDVMFIFCWRNYNNNCVKVMQFLLIFHWTISEIKASINIFIVTSWLQKKSHVLCR